MDAKHVILNSELHGRLKRFARLRGRLIYAVVEEALMEFLDSAEAAVKATPARRKRKAG